jgi:PKD repeat protein
LHNKRFTRIFYTNFLSYHSILRFFMKKLTTSLFVLLFASQLFAQQARHAVEAGTHNHSSEPKTRCSTMDVDAKLRQAHPEIGTPEDFEKWMNQAIKDLPANKTNVARTIPTIVHVIHNGTAVGSGFNISAAQVNSQFVVLNADFRRTNADASNTPAAFANLAADCNVEFCPAKVDPQGNVLAEPGIDRINRNSKGWIASGASGYSDTYIDGTIKPNSIWDPNKYFNIWVLALDVQLLGYAQFPTGSGLQGLGGTSTANTDGVVINYNAFGTMGTAAAPYNKGRTATHEVGHWLGELHIWGDDGNACNGSDYVSDTPNQGGENGNCPSFPLLDACSPSSPGVMFMNYMDYVPDACMNMFTTGQKARMDAVLANSPRRSDLLNSTVCNLPTTVTANFTTSPSPICMAAPVQFTSTSTVPVGTTPTYAWTFTGGSPASSSAANPSVTYATAGNYNVSLTVTANGSSDTKTSTISVIDCSTSGSGCDTLVNFGEGDTLTYYIAYTPPATATNWGYVSGHNNYGDIAKLEYFNYTGALPAQITDVFMRFVKGVESSANHTIDVNIWNDVAGKPGTIIGTTTLPIQTIATDIANQQYTQVTFPTPVSISNGKFYAGIKFAYNGDTVVLAMVKAGNVATNTAWEQWSDNSFNPFSLPNPNGWGINSSLAVLPAVCRTVGIDAPLTGDINLYPNPSDGNFTLEMANIRADEVAFMLFDLQGKQIYNEMISTTMGTVKKELSFDNLSEGSYIVRLLADGKYANYKLLIQK